MYSLAVHRFVMILRIVDAWRAISLWNHRRRWRVL